MCTAGKMCKKQEKENSCKSDVTGTDRKVNIEDLLTLLGEYGKKC